MTIGARIAVARERKGFSQTELAKRLGTAVLTVNRWEMGHTEPNAKNLHALAALLDVRPTWLFDGSGPMEESRLERDDDPDPIASSAAEPVSPPHAPTTTCPVWVKRPTDVGRSPTKRIVVRV